MLSDLFLFASSEEQKCLVESCPVNLIPQHMLDTMKYSLHPHRKSHMSHHEVTSLHEVRASEMTDPSWSYTFSFIKWNMKLLNVKEIELSRRGFFKKFPLVVSCFYFSSPSLLSLSDCAFNVLSTPNPLSKWNRFDLLGHLKASPYPPVSSTPANLENMETAAQMVTPASCLHELLKVRFLCNLPIGIEQALRSLGKPGTSSSPV